MAKAGQIIALQRSTMLSGKHNAMTSTALTELLSRSITLDTSLSQAMATPSNVQQCDRQLRDIRELMKEMNNSFQSLLNLLLADAYTYRAIVDAESKQVPVASREQHIKGTVDFGAEVDSPDASTITKTLSVTDRLNATEISDEMDNTMELYKGERVRKTTALVLKHVVDKFQSHFGHKDVPKVTFSVNGLTRLAYDQKYKSKDEEPADKFTSEVTVKYTEVSNSAQSIIAIDNCYIDLTSHLKKDGTPVSNYGATWVNIYIPNTTMKKLLSKIQRDTEWPMSSKSFTIDADQGLVSLSAGMDNETPPIFYTMQKVLDEGGKSTGEISISNNGTIQDIYQDKDLREIYKCTMFCTVSLSIPVPVGTEVVPKPGGSNNARIKFHVSSVRAYGVADGITTVKLQRNCIKSSVFG